MYRVTLIAPIVCLFLVNACNSNEEKKQSAQQKSFSEAAFLDITPLADGGAYAYDIGGVLWYLRGSEAMKVKEVDQFLMQPTSLRITKRERAYWVMFQRERIKRKKAESELDSYADNSDQEGEK